MAAFCVLFCINATFAFNAPNTKLRFRGPDADGFDTLPPEELKKLFAAVPRFEHRISKLSLKDYRSRQRTFSRFDGLAKLAQPWKKDSLLHLSVYDIERLKIHFWNGESGVSLQFFRSRTPNVLAAFKASRTGTSPRPEFRSLLASDNGRWSRSGFGPFELQWHDDSLVATRGNIRLLTVPFKSVPTEVYFEGALSLRTLKMETTATTPPLQQRAAAKNLLVVDNASKLSWLHELPDCAKLESKSETVELSVDAAKRNFRSPQFVTAWTSVPEADARLSEVIFQVDDADPGTAVFLGDENGKPLHRIAYFMDRPTSWLSFGYVRQATRQLDSNYNPDTFPPPYAGRNHWLRIVLGFDFIKVWVSSDGLNWCRVGDAPVSVARGGFTTLGVYADVTDEDRHIALRRIEVRPLTSLLKLARTEIRNQVPFFNSLDSMDLGTWMHKTLATRPDEVPLAEWRRACAIRSLQTSPTKAIADPLLNGLVAEGVQLDTSVAERLQLLDEAALIMDLRNSTAAQKFAGLYQSVLQSAELANDELGFDRIMSHVIDAPIWSSVSNFPFPERLARRQLLATMENAEWESVQALHDRVRFWNDSAHPSRSWWGKLSPYYSMVGWSQAFARQYVVNGDESVAPAAPSYNWRHPLVVEFSKEGYNVMTELDSALRAKAYNDACQVIAAAGSSDFLGLLPDKSDARLVIPFHTAVAWAMREHTELAEAMNKKLGSVAALRVRRAIENSDFDTVEAATIQYYGTPAAAEAHRWLGDRRMSVGQFGEAFEHYRKAMRNSDEFRTDNVFARAKMAAAMLGVDAEGTVKESVTFGGTSYTPQQLHALLAQMKQQAGSTNSTVKGGEKLNRLAHQHVPAPSVMTAQVKASFEGEYGQHPQRVRTSEYDWCAQQLGVTNDAATIYVSNRFQIVAYDINTGKKWTTGLGGEQGDAHHLSLVPMRPILAGGKVFARRIEKKGPELVCLNQSDGKLVWRARPVDHVASDPVWIHNKLLALVATFPQSGYVNLDVVQFDPTSGETINQWPMTRCTDVWGRRPPAQVIAVGDQVIATIPGLVFSFSPVGQILWIRKQSWIPSQADSRQIEQAYELPVHIDGKLFMTQPNSRAIECLDVDTGRRVWSSVVPELRRIVGLTDTNLIVETRLGFQAVQRTDGALGWNVRVERMLDGRMCGENGVFVYAQWVQLEKNKRHPVLVWIDSETGTELGRSTIEQLFDKDPRMGPFLVMAGRVWTFFGKGSKDPRRDLVELKVAGSLYPNSLADSKLSRWMPALSTTLTPQFEVVTAGWRTYAVNQGKGCGLRAEFRGQKKVLATQLQQARPVKPDKPQSRNAANWIPDYGSVRMFRCVDVPKDGKLRLTFRAGHDAGAAWRLCIDANSTEVLRQDIDDKTAPNGWKDISVDLKAHAGNRVWLTIAEVPIDTKNRQFAYIHQLKLIR